MTDVYNYNAEYQGIKLITAKEMVLKVAGHNGSGEQYLVQNVNISYQRPSKIVRELSSAKGYSYGYPPQGMMSIERIIGEKSIGDILGPTGEGIWVTPSHNGSTSNAQRTITLEPLPGSQGPRYIAHGCIVNNLSINTDSNRGLIPESVQITFGKLEEGS